ncbi:MAG TPA: phenylalanine--tRNA ligase subunit alpha, partial [Bryobacteraceae bacterium]|nr:phenylalanine--tRNA ligase subunit alpha [Bryobacteraceae bacterium]
MADSRLEELRRSTLAAFASAGSLEELEKVRVEALGRKGALAQISKEFGRIAADERALLGKLLNSVKQDLESEYESKKRRFEQAELAERLAGEWIDVTLPAPGTRPGSLHPVTQLQNEIEDLFTSLGFAVLYGPEVESEQHNFDALNIPATHPARDMQDTFWLSNGQLLRTHTSPVQVRGMRAFKPPLRMIAPGRVFRNEEVDASHEHTFYQVEGMMVDRDVSVANLIYFMKTLLGGIFGREVT